MQKQPVGPIYFNLLHHSKEWEGEIAPLLIELSKGDLKSDKIIEMLMLFNGKYCWRRASLYGRKAKKNCEYSALKSQYDKQLPSICRQFATALLQMKPEKIPLVMGQANTCLNYKKKDFVYLLLLMFFSLVPKQYSDHSQYLQKRFHDKNNFSHILQHSLFKTKCIVEYLLIAVKELVQNKQDELLTIVRKAQPKNKLQSIILASKQAPMSKITLQSNDKSIQQYNGDIKIDFANRFIGGGCLNDGCVQEEIMFAVRPQLYATTLLCQKMEDNEALAFIGFRRYFDHSGYGSTTQFKSLAKVQYKITQNYQAEEYIAAIDAVKFKQGGLQQFQRRFIDRQILKAYLGFSALGVEGRIVTGGWGCGVYHGDIQAKILIQWIAASLAGRQMVFCPFGRKQILEQRNLLQKLREGKVVQIYRLLLQAGEQKLHAKNVTLFSLASEAAPKM